ncbi:radical SAM protein [Pilimelia columellifera]|uniref:Radical SAM core domain-containing protein n=1 Tax=Pilimelia columellifera subsp. columellifera TaxID=706583 RepID=A0ABN3N4N0_9ACTN
MDVRRTTQNSAPGRVIQPPVHARPVAGVAFRVEPFGAVAYVGERDDFFALDRDHAALLGDVLARGPVAVAGAVADQARTLAALGMLRTEPPTAQRPHLGRSLVGALTELPRLSGPLVVNCFSTANCPLRCAYCHADDLMAPAKAGERWSDVAAVLRTADQVPALVAVVTGGDPIVAPERASWLLGRLAPGKRLVLDTSGAGDLGPLLPALRRHRAHVRISVDSADAAVHDRLRPTSPRALPRGASSHALAHAALLRLAEAGVAHSVQTVVGGHNEAAGMLRRLRDHLIGLGVRHWVLHMAVPAGKAERRPGLLPGPDIAAQLRDLVDESEAAGSPLDIRVTGARSAPNSVLLVDSRGHLCVQRPDGPGKEVIWPAGRDGGPEQMSSCLNRHVDWAGHASRYLNGTLEPDPQLVPLGTQPRGR